MSSLGVSSLQQISFVQLDTDDRVMRKEISYAIKNQFGVRSAPVITAPAFLHDHTMINVLQHFFCNHVSCLPAA